MGIDNEVRGTAIFNKERTHRYSLVREFPKAWGGTKGSALWIMLNPSTADENILDPTIRRCVRFSKHWGFSRMVVCNVFSYRATKPKDLESALRARMRASIDEREVWHANEAAIKVEMLNAERVVVAWGVHANKLVEGSRMIAEIIQFAKRRNTKLWCLGTNADGSPKHPLYLAETTKCFEWPRR